MAFQVNPQNLKLAVGEIADVDVSRGPANEPARFASSDLEVVEVTPQNRLIGKKTGKATVTVSRGDQTAKVDVEVEAAAYQGIALEPAEISVRVDDVAALRAMGRIDEDTQVEIDPKLLEWVRFPTGDYLEVNREALDVRGLKPTGEDFKTLTVRLGEHEATAKVRVIPGPLTLALEPAEAVELPVGQKQPLKVYASYGNGERVEVPADRVEWLADPVKGLTLSDGAVTALQPDAGPLVVKVRYQGQTSNEVQIKSGIRVPVRLTLAANPAQLPAGETGQVVLSGQSPGGMPVALDMSGVEYVSNDPNILEVNSKMGGFRAIAPGTVTVTATHPVSRDPAMTEIQVTAAPQPKKPAQPQGVRLITKAPQPIVLPVGVVFVDLRVEADIDGKPQDVTLDSIITVEGGSESAAVAVRNNSLVGIRPGEATVKAEFAGQTAENTLAFKVTETLELDAIQVGPPSVTLGVGENTRLEAVGYLKGQAVGMVTEHPAIQWKSRSPDVVRVEGPLVSALAEGPGGVTAQFKNIISDPAEIRVVGNSGLTEQLTVQPASVTLYPGESVEVGRDVKVFRGDADLSRLATVSPANPDVISYDEATRRLTAGLPGRTRVTVVVGQKTAELDVTVLTEAPPVAGGHVVIEPASGVVAVGERLPLQVYLITKDGRADQYDRLGPVGQFRCQHRENVRRSRARRVAGPGDRHRANRWMRTAPPPRPSMCEIWNSPAWRCGPGHLTCPSGKGCGTKFTPWVRPVAGCWATIPNSKSPTNILTAARKPWAFRT